MLLGALVLAAPVLIALLIRRWRFRRTGRPGKSLPIFLLGYLIFQTLAGLKILAEQLSRGTADVGDYVLLVLVVLVYTAASYGLGGLAWVVSKEALPYVLGRFNLVLSDRPESGTRAGGTLNSDLQPGERDARQRAIEECAEEAYEHVLENELVTAADHDRAEHKAARLRETILALGEKEA